MLYNLLSFVAGVASTLIILVAIEHDKEKCATCNTTLAGVIKARKGRLYCSFTCAIKDNKTDKSSTVIAECEEIHIREIS